MTKMILFVYSVVGSWSWSRAALQSNQAKVKANNSKARSGCGFWFAVFDGKCTCYLLMTMVGDEISRRQAKTDTKTNHEFGEVAALLIPFKWDICL